MSTNMEGVFAAGDSTAKRFRQVTTAVGDGTIAALASADYLNELKVRHKQYINN
jgi:thioredoxin reductase (NADPH)